MTDEPVPGLERAADAGFAEFTLPHEPFAVRVARQHVAGACSDLDPDVLGDLQLIVTELVANAVQHGAPHVVLCLRAKPFAVDVAVLDHGPGAPRMKTAQEASLHGSGRGLAIVDRLAAAWGVEPLETSAIGKMVWASVDRC